MTSLPAPAAPDVDSTAQRFVDDLEDLPIDRLDVAQPELFRAGFAPRYLARLRRESPVHRCADGQFAPYWSITRHRDIEAIELDTETFSSEHHNGGVTIGSSADDPQFFPAFISMDPPRHTAQRRVIAPAFAPERLAAIEPLLRSWSAEILDELPRERWFDWVDRVSVELTARTLALLLGFPQEQARDLIRWSDAMVAMPGHPAYPTLADKMKVLKECFDTFDKIWARRLRSPDGDDLLSLLARGEETRTMSKQELYGNILLLIVGGNDTTRNSISGSIVALGSFPAELEKLRRTPDLLSNLSPEIFRWQTPLAHMRRTATRDVTVGDKTISRGDKVVLWYLSANRDEAVFDRADEFIIDRANARRHLSFGYGVHRCIGARLADLQIRTLWQEILQRLPSFEVSETPTRTCSTFIHGYQQVLVRLPGG
ncbi:cytochrome P450 [Sphingomonas sp. DT-51]|uniref:cytochrome P450 n=1 Tax=Sphingomonas sp. DT-51 TaxID=3396165 RepID=UPI003F1BF5A9